MNQIVAGNEKSFFLSKRFLPFFLTQILGAFNDNLFKNAVIILIAAKGLSLPGMSPEICITLASAIFIFPFFLGSALSGQLADKYPKVAIIRGVKILEIVCMLIGSVGFALTSVPLLLTSILLLGIHSTLFGPVKYSILPQILTDDELLKGNSFVETATFISILFGTIAGGTLVLLENGPLYVSAFAITSAAFGLLISLFISPIAPVAPELTIGKRLLAPTIEILRLTKKTKSVFLSVLGISWFWFYGATLLQIFPVFVKHSIHADESLITLLLACFCIGTAIGSIATERVSGKNLELALVPLGSFGMSLFAIDLGLISIPESSELMTISAFVQETFGKRILTDLLLMAICGGFFTVPLYTLIQQRVEKKEQSRVIAGNNILNALFMVLASGILAALFASNINPPQIFLILAGLNACVAFYIFRLLPEFILRFFAWILCRIMYRRKTLGHDFIPSNGPAVLVANHISFVDWLIIAGSVRRPIRFVMDHGIASSPGLSIFLKLAKVIPIASEKENPQIKELAFKKIESALLDGELVCIFPEGKITNNGEMNVFRPGFERAVNSTPVPVIPMALVGLWGSMFSRKDGPAFKKPPQRFRAHIYLVIGSPLEPQQAKADFVFGKVSELVKSVTP